jgi:6-phosphogluconolactonase
MTMKRCAGRWAAGAAVGVLLSLCGCAGFFVPNTTTTTTTSTGSSSGNYVYAANQITNTLSAFVVGSSTLTAVSGSPYTLATGLAVASVTVTRPNTFVYAGGSGAIACYSIGTTGQLTLVNATAASAAANYVSLETSPDGNWLIALDGITTTLYVYGINTSTGALTPTAQVPYGSGVGAGTIVPTKVRISPNGSYIIAALGTGGDAIFTFNTSTGIPQQATSLTVASGYSDNAVAIDANNTYVYFARGGPTSGSSGVASYLLGSGGGLTPVQTLAVSGNAPYSILLDSTGAYAYTANRADGTVSGFSVSSGMLTALSGSPYPSGTTTTSLARDNGSKYVIAASYGGSSDLTMYAFDALVGGKLDAVAKATSGTDPAGSIAVAATH